MTESRTAGPPLVRLRGVEYRFGATRALEGLDLDLRAGATYGLLGNNGAGKTTAIHAILGLLRPPAGTVEVFGEDPWRRRIQVLCRVGYFPEASDPYEWMTLRQLFRLGEQTFATWSRDRCRELCSTFALDLDQRFGVLSRGRAAKAKLVFALAREPELLVLDEPTGGLDPGSRQELLGWIARATADRRLTTLFSSHHLDEVASISSHVGILHHGRLAVQVSRRELGSDMAFLDFSAARFHPPPELEALRIRGKERDGVHRWLVRDRHDPRLMDALSRASLGAAVLEPVALPSLFHFVTTD